MSHIARLWFFSRTSCTWRGWCLHIAYFTSIFKSCMAVALAFRLMDLFYMSSFGSRQEGKNGSLFAVSIYRMFQCSCKAWLLLLANSFQFSVHLSIVSLLCNEMSIERTSCTWKCGTTKTPLTCSCMTYHLVSYGSIC